MAILALITGVGIDRDLYDALREEVGWEHNYPNGAISHCASFDEAGNAHVADVWASVDDLNAFIGGRLMPAMQKLNAPPPDVQVFPVHNLNVYAAVEDFLLA